MLFFHRILRRNTIMMLVMILFFASVDVYGATLEIFAADALPKPMMQLKTLFEKQHPHVTIHYYFLASGALKGDIEEGASADIFLCANARFQQEFIDKGYITLYKLFAYNHLAVGTPFNNPAHVTQANLIQKLFDKNVSLVTSTPNADPAGDYTWKMFRAINKQYPGAFHKIVSHVNKLLDAALVIPVLESGNADMGILYMSQLAYYRQKASKINIIKIPKKFDIKAKFTVSILNQSHHKLLDKEFEKLLLSRIGQKILNKWGFSPVKNIKQ